VKMTWSPSRSLRDQYLNAAKFTAVRADPGDGVATDAPLVLLHAVKTDLESASTRPAKQLLGTTTMTRIALLLPFLAPPRWSGFASRASAFGIHQGHRLIPPLSGLLSSI
jgi:hypothetical protein